ncbi:c-type cytochrome [Vibrio sonorensis]|uniref:c-type cytochrome n=1 Tax=Vibrio sonorensis TaxID=1004316 RepID=UPI0008D9FC12|nr:c-type cytochrome [Vibrio sonorensis]
MRVVEVRAAVFALVVGFLSLSAMAGEAAFEKVCSSCHSGGFKGMVTGAPNVNEREEWQSFHASKNEEEMRQVVMQGLNDHKPKGGCKKCSDSEINAAIDYVLSVTK